MIYVVISLTMTGKKLHAAFESLELAGAFAVANKIESWHVEAIPHIK